MIAQIRAELLKIRSTRTTIGLVLGMLALIVLFALLSGLLTKAPQLTSTEDQRGPLSVGSFATSEVRTRTEPPTRAVNCSRDDSTTSLPRLMIRTWSTVCATSASTWLESENSSLTAMRNLPVSCLIAVCCSASAASASPTVAPVGSSSS